MPDHGARIKAIETLLREGLGRVGEAEVVEPRMPTSADEVKNLSNDELRFVFALTHATGIRAVVDNGDDALRSEVESWTPKARASLARVLAERVGVPAPPPLATFRLGRGLIAGR